jgi:Family of unknown function (DUF5675)
VAGKSAKSQLRACGDISVHPAWLGAQYEGIEPPTWELTHVPGRSAVLMHVGNSTKDTEGCVLVGMGLSVTQLLSSISDSRMALDLMRRETRQQCLHSDNRISVA